MLRYRIVIENAYVLQGGVIQTGKRHIELKRHNKNKAGKVHITKRHVAKSWSAKSLGADYRKISRSQTFFLFLLNFAPKRILI